MEQYPGRWTIGRPIPQIPHVVYRDDRGNRAHERYDVRRNEEDIRGMLHQLDCEAHLGPKASHLDHASIHVSAFSQSDRGLAVNIEPITFARLAPGKRRDQLSGVEFGPGLKRSDRSTRVNSYQHGSSIRSIWPLDR